MICGVFQERNERLAALRIFPNWPFCYFERQEQVHTLNYNSLLVMHHQILYVDNDVMGLIQR